MKIMHISPAKVGRVGYRVLTSPIRLQPDFIIIGAQKCGTTSLYMYLIEHPAISEAWTKEIDFFNNHYQKGNLGYQAHFPTTVESYF